MSGAVVAYGASRGGSSSSSAAAASASAAAASNGGWGRPRGNQHINSMSAMGYVFRGDNNSNNNVNHIRNQYLQSMGHSGFGGGGGYGGRRGENVDSMSYEMRIETSQLHRVLSPRFPSVKLMIRQSYRLISESVVSVWRSSRREMRERRYRVCMAFIAFA